jgi:hypothetical protein
MDVEKVDRVKNRMEAAMSDHICMQFWSDGIWVWEVTGLWSRWMFWVSRVRG